jgi:hypothetical protein
MERTEGSLIMLIPARNIIGPFIRDETRLLNSGVLERK